MSHLSGANVSSAASAVTVVFAPAMEEEDLESGGFASSDGGGGGGGSSVFLFPDDDYGLLNAAKFELHRLWLLEKAANLSGGGGGNGTPSSYGGVGATLTAADFEVVTEYPSSYTQAEVAFLALIMTAMMIVIVVGNLLVVIAIATENNLTSVQNWFIASLAAADLLIGLMIMPFSLAYELMGYWMFGEIWCEIHSASDVFLCTSSIMNICLISLDRYWSITRAIDYLNARTPSRVAIMIGAVWILSGLISIPPLLGWKKDVDMDWFRGLLDEKGNMTHGQYLLHLEDAGIMKLENFTETLESVVYPQCGVSADEEQQHFLSVPFVTFGRIRRTERGKRSKIRWIKEVHARADTYVAASHKCCSLTVSNDGPCSPSHLSRRSQFSHFTSGTGGSYVQQSRIEPRFLSPLLLLYLKGVLFPFPAHLSVVCCKSGRGGRAPILWGSRGRRKRKKRTGGQQKGELGRKYTSRRPGHTRPGQMAAPSDQSSFHCRCVCENGPSKFGGRGSCVGGWILKCCRLAAAATVFRIHPNPILFLL